MMQTKRSIDEDEENDSFVSELSFERGEGGNVDQGDELGFLPSFDDSDTDALEMFTQDFSEDMKSVDSSLII